MALHLDHGSRAAALTCLGSGFSSVMYDGSKVPLAQNLQTTAELVEQAWAGALRSYITAGRDLEKRGHDPVKLLSPAREAIAQAVRQKIQLFGSCNRC